ncbi:hypothetical protein BGZ81_004295, partial [Podila clonocystis]
MNARSLLGLLNRLPEFSFLLRIHKGNSLQTLSGIKIQGAVLYIQRRTLIKALF